MKNILYLLIVTVFCHKAYSQAWVWEKPVNTTNNSIATDPNNNIIVLAQNGVATQLSKYTKDGALIWSKLLTKATAFTPSGSLVVDRTGNIYTFTEGFDSVNHFFTGIKGMGVTKFAANGNILWHQLSSFRSALGNRFPIRIDADNNVYIGYYQQATAFPGAELVKLGDSVFSLVYERYFIAVGAITSAGVVKWIRAYNFKQTASGGLSAGTNMSIAGGNVYITGYSGKYNLFLDNGLVLGTDRCTAWLAVFDRNTGISKWGKVHQLIYYCTGSVCSCSSPSVMGNNATGNIALTSNLVGAFVFKPQDTVASAPISPIFLPPGAPAKSYYTVYDSVGNPVKANTIEVVPNQFFFNENLTGSRNNFFFIQYSDTLRKVDTGFNLIWKVTLPPATASIFIPQNSNDIIATYTRAGVVYLAKMTDSAGVVSGRTYADWDNNGTYTSADSALSNVLITTNTLANAISGNDNGKYYLYAAPSAYTLSAQFNHPYYQFLPAIHNAAITQYSDTVTGKDFRLRPLFSFTDVSTSFTALNIARPGRNAFYNINVKNIGPTTSPIQVGLKIPVLTTYQSVSGGIVVVNSPDSITVNMGNVNPFETKQAMLTLLVATTASIHDTLRYYPKATPYFIDTIKANNTDTLIQPVRTSFDPNEKEVHLQKRPFSDTSRALVYTVHFQNTGNDTAFYVRIADTLSSKHDLKTFNFITASHPVTTEINNNIIQFIFNPIELPDSNHNERLSHGFVKFSIKPKAPFSISDTLFNRVAIYFDYNNPVITNNIKSWYFTQPVPPPLVVIQSFNAVKQNLTAVLNFVTASEPGVSLFEIERSTDSLVFAKIGNWLPKGSATAGSSYSFTDINPDITVNFYRIKIVYADGRIAYSNIIIIRNFTVSPQPPASVKVFPNPVKGVLNLALNNIAEPKIVTCIVTDVTGKIVWSAQINTAAINPYPLHTEQWAPGVYFITLSNENFIYRKKIAIIH